MENSVRQKKFEEILSNGNASHSSIEAKIHELRQKLEQAKADEFIDYRVKVLYEFQYRIQKEAKKRDGELVEGVFLKPSDINPTAHETEKTDNARNNTTLTYKKSVSIKITPAETGHSR